VKVALVIGPYRSGECGVGDYTMCLRDALNKLGVDAQVVTCGDWRVRAISKTRDALRTAGFDIVHIQYPTAGFGTKLTAQALALLQPCVTTIHEASERHFLRKLSLLPFAVRPQHLIFTSSFERRFAAKWAPWISRCSSVIPVGSNIPAADRGGARDARQIVHFGLILPKKGLEDVVELGRLLKQAELPLVIHVIGRVPPRHAGYFDMLQSASAGLPIVWHGGLSEEEVARKLVESWVAYLPFPDGASDRRTTLKAALQSGLVVVTTEGPHTPRDLHNLVKFCADPQQAFTTIRALIDDHGRLADMSAKAAQYGRRFSWEYIAGLHLRVYGSVLTKSSSVRHWPRMPVSRE